MSIKNYAKCKYCNILVDKLKSARVLLFTFGVKLSTAHTEDIAMMPADAMKITNAKLISGTI